MGIGNRPITHDSSVAAYNLHRVPVETIVVICLFCAAIAAVIGHTKNRSIGESFLIGALLGLIGVIIVLLLPNKAAPGMAKPGWYPDPAGTNSQRYRNGREWSDLPPRPAKGPLA
jgi:hypothetical protein